MHGSATLKGFGKLRKIRTRPELELGYQSSSIPPRMARTRIDTSGSRRDAEETNVTIPPESIDVGKCYLGDNGKVWRVVRIWPDSRVQFEFRARSLSKAKTWKPGMLLLRDCASPARREVPCDWTPEMDETR